MFVSVSNCNAISFISQINVLYNFVVKMEYEMMIMMRTTMVGRLVGGNIKPQKGKIQAESHHGSERGRHKTHKYMWRMYELQNAGS